MSDSTQQVTPDPMRPWWREVYYSDFTTLQKKVFVDIDLDEMTWLEWEPAAWVYELVHHFCAGMPELPGYTVWPAFPDLNIFHRVSLTNVVDAALGFRPVVRVPPPPGADPKSGYSKGFPGYSWDLLADEKPLTDAFLGWIQAQRKEFEIERSKGVKQGVSHNKRELPRTLDWRLVEVLDHRKGEGDPLSDSARKRAEKGRDYAMRFYEPVLSTIRFADEELGSVMQSLLKATPQSPIDLDPDNLDMNELKGLLGQFETLLFGRAIEGSPPITTASDTPRMRKLEDIIRQFR